MKIYLTIIVLLGLFTGCKYSTRTPQSDSLTSELDTKNAIEQIPNTTIIPSEVDFLMNNNQLYETIEILYEDFNGDGNVDKAEFRRDSTNAGIIITHGITNDTTVLGFGNKIGHIDNFNWVNKWGILKDTETYEVTFMNGDIFDSRIVELENVSIQVIQKNEDYEGGGVITFKQGFYIWVHQAD